MSLQTIKHALKFELGRKFVVDNIELNTTLTEIEATVNSRALIYFQHKNARFNFSATIRKYWKDSWLEIIFIFQERN